MSLPFPTNAFSETMENAGIGLFNSCVVSLIVIVVDTQGLVLRFHKRVEKLSCCLCSSPLKEK